MPTEVRLFGPPAYRNDADWRPLPLDKRGAALALVAHTPEGWSRRRLAKLFWPSTTAERGLVNLRGLLARLNSVELASQISRQGERLVWDVTCDTRDFRAAVAENRWLEATELYAAPFLQDLDVLDAPELSAWIELERRELDAAFKLASVRSAELLAEAGEFNRVESSWRSAFDRDPYDESFIEASLRLAARYGPLRVAGLRLYERFGRRVAADLGVAPRSALGALAHALRTQAQVGSDRFREASGGPDALLTARASTRYDRLPSATVPLVPRDVEVTQVIELFDAQAARAVTIVGPGGVGKTQLALQVARLLTAQFQGGCWFVPLVGVESSDLLSGTVAQAVGARLVGSTDARAQLAAFLRDRSALVVLDNLEHLPGSGAFIEEIVTACPQVKVLATSRAPLEGLNGEVYELGGMSYPASSDDELFDSYDGIRLFALRARQAAPGYFLAAADRPVVSAICRSVGGAPLGIELAAAWLGTLDLEEIAEALEQGRPSLVHDLRDVPARHRSLRTAFEHSWQLLAAPERHALAAFSVFSGDFTTEAAEHVAECGPMTIAKLLDWSLVRRAGPGRIDLHELIRQFAAQELATDQANESTARRRHTEFYVGLVAREGRWFRGGAEQRRALSAVGADVDNVRSAWSQARSAGSADALERLLPMFHFYEIRGLYQEGADVFAASVDVLTDANLAKARALTAQSVLLGRLGRLQQCRATVEQSLAILEAIGEVDGLTLLHLGVVHHLEGDVDAAEASWRRTIEVAAATGDEWSKAGAICNLAEVAWRLRDDDVAGELLAEGGRLFEKIQDRWGLAMTLVNTGERSLRRGDLSGAHWRLSEALRQASEIDQLPVMLQALYLLGELAVAEGDLAAAAARFDDCAVAARSAASEEMLALALEALENLGGRVESA